MPWSHFDTPRSPTMWCKVVVPYVVALAMSVAVFSFPIQTHAAETNAFPFSFFESVQIWLMPLMAPFRAIINTAQAPNSEVFWSLSEKERVEFIKTIARRNALKAEDFLTKAVALRTEFTLTGHTYGHIIGEEVYRHYGVAGMRQCGMAFGFACYHGVSIAALSERPSDATIRTIENECYHTPEDSHAIPSSGFSRACIHGLGHGIASMEAFDIGAFTTRCDVVSQGEVFFSDELDVYTDSRIACNNGAFMEFIMSSGLMKRDPQKLWDICADLDERHQRSCAIYAIMIPQSQRQVSTVADAVTFCASAPTSVMRDSCFSEPSLLGLTLDPESLVKEGIAEAALGDTLIKGCDAARNDPAYYTHCINVAAGFIGLKDRIRREGLEQKDTALLRQQMNTICEALTGKNRTRCQERNDIILASYAPSEVQ